MQKLTLLFSLLCLACHSPQGGPALPGQRPNDLMLIYHVDGGMNYYSEDLRIAADSCIYNKNDGGKLTHEVFKASPEKLDELYGEFKKNHFDEIRYRTEKEVYDRGGISMELSWDKGQRKINVSDAQASFVSKDWQKEWRDICSYIAAFPGHAPKPQ